MSEIVNALSQKRYNEIRRTIISDAFDVVLNAIASQASVNNKDKSFTMKKLATTLDSLYKKIGEINSDKLPSEIINSLKPKMTPQLNNTFCYKLHSKRENKKKKNIVFEVPIIFTPNIQLAIEVPSTEIKKDTKLQKSAEHYHFFIFPFNENDNKYVITYAEENKYSKREIIEVTLNNSVVDKSILPEEIKDKYNLI